MKIERAIEILNPEHREHYESIEPVNEACRMGMKALEKQIPKKPRVNDDGWFCCPDCGETFSLVNTLHKRNKFCGECSKALDWSDTNDR